MHKLHAHAHTRTHAPRSRTLPSEAALPAPLLPSASSAQRPSDQHGGAGERGAERPAVGPQAERAVRARGNRGSNVPYGEDSRGGGRAAGEGEALSIRELLGTGTWEVFGKRQRCPEEI